MADQREQVPVLLASPVAMTTTTPTTTTMSSKRRSGRHRRHYDRPLTNALLGWTLLLPLFLLLISILHSSCSPLLPVIAMHADEVGLNDFAIATAGHGRATYASYLPATTIPNDAQQQSRSQSQLQPGPGVLITSNSPPARGNLENFKFSPRPSSCHVAARDATDGELLWRRDACSSSNSSGSTHHRHRHSTSTSVTSNTRGVPLGTATYTLDDSGVLRGWNVDDGGDVAGVAGAALPRRGVKNAAGGGAEEDDASGGGAGGAGTGAGAGAALFDVEVPGASPDGGSDGYGPRVRSFRGRPGKPPLVAALFPRSSTVIPTLLSTGDGGDGDRVREIGGSTAGDEEVQSFDGLSFHLGDTGEILPIVLDPDDNTKNFSDAVSADKLLRLSGAREPRPGGAVGGGGGGARIVAMEGAHGMGDRIALVVAWPSPEDPSSSSASSTSSSSAPCSSVAVIEFQRTYGGMGGRDPPGINVDHASVLDCPDGKNQRVDLDSIRLVSAGGGGPMVVAALSASGDAVMTSPVGRKGEAAGFGPSLLDASEVVGGGGGGGGGGRAMIESLDVLEPTSLPLLRVVVVGVDVDRGRRRRPVVLSVGEDGTLAVVAASSAIEGGGGSEGDPPDPSVRRSHVVAACRDPTDRNNVLLLRVDGSRPADGTCADSSAGGTWSDTDSSSSDRYRILLTRWEESTGDETVVARRTVRPPDDDSDFPLLPSIHGDASDLYVTCPGPHDRNKRKAGGSGEATPAVVHAFLSTSGGTSVSLRISTSDGSVETTWMAEENLATIRSVTFVDASHHHALALAAAASSSSDQEDDDALPTLEDRLRMQLHSLREVSGYLRRILVGGHSEAERRDRDVGFGFAKVVVALSDSSGGGGVGDNARVFGIDASLPGPQGSRGEGGRVVWSRLLPSDATRHVLVHGGGVGNFGRGDSGGHGHHDHEVLILSELVGGGLEYSCLDGVTGRVLDRGNTAATSSTGGAGKVVQVVPLRVGVHHHQATGDGAGGHHSPIRCRQHALVLWGDDDGGKGVVSVVPDSSAARVAVTRSLLNGDGEGEDDDKDRYGGYYMHRVDVDSGTLRSLQVVPGEDDDGDAPLATTVLVGEATFPTVNERIVSVGYPPADEVVQSPATVLGDDSLLLKYLNPHLAAVVTRATEDHVRRMEAEVAGDGGGGDSSSSSSPFVSAFGGTGEAKVVGEGANKGASSSSSGGTTTKKPLGASKPGEEGPPPSSGSSTAKSSAVPTLFVNLVDTVSGRVLYRVSHVGAEPYRGDDGDGDEGRRGQGVPVVVSENWVVYSFWNVKTKRTEVGVLTLHEGMIDKHGLTAFSGPHQETTFSGFDSPKPIVLHRTYGLAKTVTALGVTRTARGISSKQFVAALGSDQILSIDRRLLDPRRPSGELRDTEKAEGLLRYHPLVPLFPQKLVSYHVPVEGVTGIASAAANVESQSLVLAYGGPDVFFARVAPSKGFDLLPDSFNRALLSVVVVALVCLVFVLQRMSGAKNLKVSWS